MSDTTVPSTAETVSEVPVKKSHFSKKNIALVAGSVAATAAAAYAIVKFNSEDTDDDTETSYYDPAVVETLSDLENPNQS